MAEALGFADSSPLRKILRDSKRTTSRDRLEQLRRLRGQAAGAASSGTTGGVGAPGAKTASGAQGGASAGGAATGGKSSGGAAKGGAAKSAAAKGGAAKSGAAKSGAAKSAAAKGGAAKNGASQAQAAGDDDYVTGSKVQEFKSRVRQLRQGGWTIDTLAARIGYHHGRSLSKALGKGQVRRRIYDALMRVPARRDGAVAQLAQGTSGQAKPSTGGAKSGAAKGGATKGGAASRPAPAMKKTTSTTVGAAGGAQRAGGLLGSAPAYLDAARRHLQLARDEVRRAGSASQLLAPGLQGIADEIDAIGRRLNL